MIIIINNYNFNFRLCGVVRFILNWEEIKLEYVTSDMSYRELSEKFGISFSTLSKTAVKEKWSRERNKHRKKVATKAQQKIETKKAKSLAKEMEIAEAISDILKAAVSSPEQFVELRDKSGNIQKYSMGEITAALEALSKLERSKRSLYGIISEKEKQTFDIARERLDIAKNRASGTGADTAECGVVLLPQVQAEAKPGE